MIEFGSALKAAREAKGLTIQELADITRLLPSIVEGLECENFSKIVAPIYGRGFVKLYCETVGIDPKPYIAEFMEIYNGNRDDVIKTREVTPEVAPATPEPHVAPEPVAPEPPVAPIAPEPPVPGKFSAQMGLFDAPVAPEPAARPMPPPKSEPSQKPVLSRYATPITNRLEKVPSIVPTILRYTVVGIVAIGLLLLTVVGLKSLYRATTAPARPQETVVTPTPNPAATSRPASATPTSAANKRQPIAVPSLYID